LDALVQSGKRIPQFASDLNSKRIECAMPKAAKFSQPARHEKITKTPGKPQVTALSDPTHVTLRSKSRKSRHTPEKIPHWQYIDPSGDHLALIMSAPVMELRKHHYKAEANTHRNMKSRQSKGYIIHPDFEDFRSFLLHVGPMPGKGMTLDRINNSDPEYAPGKVRWADKHTQNSNKGDSLTFHCSRTGMTYTTSILAKLQHVSPATIRKRHERGWTVDENISGTRSVRASAYPKTSSYIPEPLTRFPPGLYTSKQLAMLNTSEGYLTHSGDIQFHRDAHFHQIYREEHSEEWFMMTHAEMMENEYLSCITEEQHERHFLKLWPAQRPHIVYATLNADQKDTVRKYDPEWAAKREAGEKAKQGLGDLV
jgi:hypothetical protein